MSRKIQFKTVDVFTDQIFLGNPLAVFLDCSDLTTNQMQLIAKEIGYSETVFIFAPENPKNSAMIKIFSPASELPFAGHPNIGVAYILASYPKYIPGKSMTGTMILEQRAGNVKATAEMSKEGTVISNQIIAPERFNLLEPVPVLRLCDALCLEEAVICRGTHLPCIASVGLPFCVLKVNSLDALLACNPNLPSFQCLDVDYKYSSDGFSILVYAEEGTQRSGFDISLRARVFCPLMGIVEDPATGSACAALAGLLLSTSKNRKQEINVSITQGIEIGRKSVIEARAFKDENDDIRVEIGGRCVELINGVLEI